MGKRNLHILFLGTRAREHGGSMMKKIIDRVPKRVKIALRQLRLQVRDAGLAPRCRGFFLAVKSELCCTPTKVTCG